jgi:hypothetical protein
MIIEKGKVSMDPIKVEGVRNWPTPACVKDIQAFMGFANFYQRFILGFSNIARPMNDLLRKGVEWSWGEKQQKAFDELKSRFTSAPILVMPDSERKHKIEVDASDYATGSVLSQEMDDGLWHPVAYYLKSMNDTECNYEIYDKELLAIIRALEEWRQYIQGATHPVEIWTDHKNLKYFMTSQKLTRRQARWSLLLAEYEFTLTHRPGVQNDKADRLSQRSDHGRGVENDNSDRMLLKPEYFQVNAMKRGQILVQGEKTLLKEIRECTEREPKVMQALKNLTKAPIQLRRGLEEWNTEDGLVMFRGLVYVPNNKEIRCKILELFHDSPAAGHPGHAKTLELVSRNYWWPQIAKYVNDFVDECEKCKSTKVFPAKTHGPLKLNKIPEGPWQTITCDLIIDLPLSEGFDSIFVVVDRYTKQTHLIPTTKDVDAEGIAKIFLNHVWKHHGTPKKVISDRGTQFTSRFMGHVSP